MVKGVPDDTADELCQRLRDGLIELLSRRAGSHLYRRVDGFSEQADRAAHTIRAAEERGTPQHRGPCVLFVYDGDKLRSPTREEIEADRANPHGKHTYMYAKKPVSGLELKDALVGMVRFDAPGD